ncbi:MAG: type II toxin-antitoxin system death-on-curing family toxin [Gammaproteobacteria bacterium]|nr:type II toxin-antitoxin system death-on-curing family toxin [Gammaproteobacteria bacterium]
MSESLVFIAKSNALSIHEQQIARFGGCNGLRDEGLLESALGAAEHCWVYTDDIYQTAAQYCVSLAKNHPFVDGNKRVAAAAMLTFLVLNGIKPSMTSDQLYDWVIDVATSKIDREGLAKLLAGHCR